MKAFSYSVTFVMRYWWRYWSSYGLIKGSITSKMNRYIDDVIYFGPSKAK